jgi:hypothetical protein
MLATPEAATFRQLVAYLVLQEGRQGDTWVLLLAASGKALQRGARQQPHKGRGM